MQVETSVELGRDDPALEFPWQSEDGTIAYQDLRRDPALIDNVSEIKSYPELRDFLLRINAPDFFLQTAKCDLWFSSELAPDEDVFHASRKFVSYVDLVFSSPAKRLSFTDHQLLTSRLCKLLTKAPEIAGSIEFVIRHCHYHQTSQEPTEHRQQSESRLDNPCASSESLAPQSGTIADTGTGNSGENISQMEDRAESITGFCITSYVSGYGESDREAQRSWSIAVRLLQYAIIQAATL